MSGSWKDDARQRAKEKQQGATFKLLPGQNCLRLLPSKKNPKAKPYMEIRVHRNVGPEEALTRCGKDMDGNGKCWLCDVKIPELEKSASPQKRKQAAAMASKDQLIAQISPVNTENNKFGKPQTWWISTGGARSLGTGFLGLISNPKRNYEDPIKGFNLNIERTGSGMLDTRYGAIIPDDEPSRVPPDILAASKPLESLVSPYSFADQKACYLGQERPSREDVAGEEEPADEAEETFEEEGEGEEAVEEEGAEEEGAEEEEEVVEEDTLEEEVVEEEEGAEESEYGEEEVGEDEEIYEEVEEEEEAPPPPPRKKQAAPPPPAPKKKVAAPPASAPKKKVAPAPPPPPARRPAAAPAKKVAPKGRR